MAEEVTVAKSIFNRVTSIIAIPWVLFLIGLICSLVGLFVRFDTRFDNTTWNDIFKEAGSILIVGVLIGYITSTAQFMGVFKNELEGIIYEARFLNKRTDIDFIWEKVSKALFKSKFPEISNDLLKVIKDKYLPLNDDVSYYKDYKSAITVTWIDKEKKIIEMAHVIKFELIASNKELFTFPLDSRVNVSGLNKDDYSTLVQSYKVNGESTSHRVVRNDVVDGIFHYSIEVDLKGSEKYSISKEIIKKYNIEKDNYISFSAKYLVKDFRIQVFHPKDLELTFINKGTSSDFIKHHKREDYLEYQYNGLLLPKQGHVIIINQK